MEKVRTGSTRIMTAVEPGVIALRYTDRWSAFDRGSSPQAIPLIGAARCACAVKSFKLARVAGLPSHFIEQVDKVTIHVQEFSVPGRNPLSGEVHGNVLNAEWIWRVAAFGSLLERIREGKVDPVSLGFPPGVEVTEGMPLPKLLLECTTKFEATDRHLTNDQARNSNNLTEKEWSEAWDLIGQAIKRPNLKYQKAGFMCPDGKLELGVRPDGTFVLVDVFGTQDENRIIETHSGKLFSKDLIRNWLKQTAWKTELDTAKKAYPADKSKWPPYPTLPDELVALVSARYAEVALRYGGVRV